MGTIDLQNKSRELAEKFEESIRRELDISSRNTYSPRPRTPEFMALSEEERRKIEHAEMTQHTLQSGVYAMFDRVAAEVRSPRHLICLPSQLAHDLYMGTNEVMRLIASNDSSEERFLLAEYARKSMFPRYQGTPTMRTTAFFHRHFNTTVLPAITIGECYWLFLFCQWLGCTTTSFSNALTELLNGDASNIEFRDQLQHDNPQHHLLATWARDQYQELIGILHDL